MIQNSYHHHPLLENFNNRKKPHPNLIRNEIIIIRSFVKRRRRVSAANSLHRNSPFTHSCSCIMAHCFKWSNLMHHLRVDDATRISLIWVAPRIRFHEENFAWDGDNSGACYSTYIACARCWTKSITTSPGTIPVPDAEIWQFSVQAFTEERFSLHLSLSQIARN